MDNKQKYLKYKNKYLYLKNQKAGFTPQQVPPIIVGQIYYFQRGVPVVNSVEFVVRVINMAQTKPLLKGLDQEYTQGGFQMPHNDSSKKMMPNNPFSQYLVARQLVFVINNNVIIERKTLTDLASSIKDGRYREQSFRLQKAMEEGNKIIYMIEGILDLYVGSIPKETLVRTFYSLMNKGFNVFLTKNSKDTAYFILQFAEKIKTTEKTTKISLGENYEESEGIIHKSQNFAVLTMLSIDHNPS